MRADELFDDGEGIWNAEEFLAHRFAAGLLMPKIAVEAAFARRGWSTGSLRGSDVYIVSQDLGVGYSTLIGHLERTLKRISSDTAVALRKLKLPRLRSQLAGFPIEHDLLVVDRNWGKRPLEMEVGDIAILPEPASFDGACAALNRETHRQLVAIIPGTGHLVLRTDRVIVVRVCRRNFAGLARYRYLEEPKGVY
jgi:hypothetical protein